MQDVGCRIRMTASLAGRASNILHPTSCMLLLVPECLDWIDPAGPAGGNPRGHERDDGQHGGCGREDGRVPRLDAEEEAGYRPGERECRRDAHDYADDRKPQPLHDDHAFDVRHTRAEREPRSEEHTSELQSL